MKHFKTHLIEKLNRHLKHDFQAEYNNLNNFKEFKFSKMKHFKAYHMQTLKRHLKHDFQANYRQFKKSSKILNFKKVKIFKAHLRRKRDPNNKFSYLSQRHLKIY